MESLKDMLARDAARSRRDAERFAALDDGECQLCHAVGEDKRSLFIRCFYAVHEAIPEAIDLRDVEGHEKQGYYLRLCKACRGSLLGHLRDWRAERIARRGRPMDHDGNDEDLSGGDPERNIPIRENGAIRYLTRKEWDTWSQQR